MSDINVKVGAQVGELQTKMRSAADSVQSAAERMGFGVGGLASKMLALAPAAAVVEALRKSFEVFGEAVDQVNRLSHQFGISAEQASALRIAIDDVNAANPGFKLSTDQVGMSLQRISMTLRTNEAAFRALGVQTRDAQGNFRPALDIFMDTNAALGDLKEGTDRNTAASLVYGRAAGDAASMIALTRDRMAEAAEKGKQLGSEIGPDRVAELAQFRGQWNDIKDQFEGVAIQIGAALLPSLNSVATSFKDVLPAALEATKVVLQTIIALVHDLVLGFQVLANVANAAVESVYQSFDSLGNALKRVAHGDIKGAVSELSKGGQKVSDAWHDAFQNITDDAVKANKAIEEVITGESSSSKSSNGIPGSIPKGTKSFHAPADDNAIEAQINARRKQADTNLDIVREELSKEKQLGIISAQDEIQGLKSIEEQKSAIEIQSIEERAKLAKNQTVVEKAKLNAELEDAQNKHNLNMVKLDNQATLEMKKHWDDLFNSINSALDKAVTGIIQGTTTLGKALKDMAQSIVLELIRMDIKRGLAYVATQMTMTNAAKAGAAERSAIDKQSAIESVAQSAWATLKNIANYAWEAAAAAYKSVASIPDVGPYLAPATAAAAVAGVMAMAGHIASAAGGYDIPSGVNPMTQLHAREMVLPASLADKVRNMSADGGGPAINVHYTANVQAIDRRGMANFFEQHKDSLVATVTKQARNFRT